MLAEYILARGQKIPVSLSACAIRRNLAEQKEDYLSACLKKGINTNETDLSQLSLYLRHDLLTTCELFHSIESDYSKPESESLAAVKRVTFDTCRTLTELYMQGVKVDLSELGQRESRHRRQTTKEDT
jgi:DNA polymerase I-like protein with 3'-5' exonuclease and polymerase domains